MNRTARASAAALAAVLSGCASSLSGVGGTNGYACKAPEGALCTSVSGVYANSQQGRPLSPQPAEKTPAKAPASTEPATRPSTQPVTLSGPIRSGPRILRLWIAPWEDADGDLHEEALVHVVVDPGRWLIEHVRPLVRERMDGIAPPSTPATPPQPEKAPHDTPEPTRFPIAPGELPSVRDVAPAER
jgi:conjugal transfer pilus assembly protein TraV